MADYELRPVDATDAGLLPVVALLAGVFPDAKHFTAEVLRWQYRLNPTGSALGFNAWHGTELVGHYATIPMLARVNGTVERGLLSLNTATAPAHQGKGLFTKLANATYALAADAGYGFVAGVANLNSTPGFLRKLGFELVSPLRAMIGVGTLPRRDPEVIPAFAPVRDAAAIAWRVQHPAYPYSAYTEQGRSLVLSHRSQYGARFVMGELDAPVPAAVLPQEPGIVFGKVLIGLDPAMHWGGKAYVNIPMRFRPSPLNLIFKDLTGQGRTLDPRTVRWDPMDFDIL
ncbi:MAG: GNAT family N-acetyltransferase [Flavobacteriales bacterium]|nr:GNAT family N-acetyltransferase [Flavobacteriales bacterium]